MKDLDTANLMSIFLYCRYFEMERFGLVIPKDTTKNVKDRRNELLCHTKSGEDCLQISCNVYQQSVLEAFKFVSDLARPIFIRYKECLQRFLLSQWVQARKNLTDSLKIYKQALENMFGPNGVYQQPCRSQVLQTLHDNEGSFFPLPTGILDVVSLPSLSQDQTDIIENHLRRQRSVRRFFANECKELQEASALSQNFQLQKGATDIELFLKNVNRVISATAELLLIADISSRHNDT
jgi:hypothetical protein